MQEREIWRDANCILEEGFSCMYSLTGFKYVEKMPICKTETLEHKCSEVSFIGMHSHSDHRASGQNKKMKTSPSFSKDVGYITPEVLPRNNTESNGDYIVTYTTRMDCLITPYAAQGLLISILLMGLELLPLPLMLALCTLLNGRLMTV